MAGFALGTAGAGAAAGIVFGGSATAVAAGEDGAFFDTGAPPGLGRVAGVIGAAYMFRVERSGNA